MNYKQFKNLNKNFNKEWDKLSSNDKKQCVNFMLKTLNKADRYYKSTYSELLKAKNKLDKVVDTQIKDEAQDYKKCLELFKKRKIRREKIVQDEILNNNKQVLFSDIATQSLLDTKTVNLLDCLLARAEVVSENTKYFSPKTVAKTVAHIELMAENISRRVKEFATSKKKVNELFVESLNKDNSFVY